MLTDKHQHLFYQIPLIKDLALNLKHSLLEKLDYTVYEIKEGDIIARQDSECRYLYVLLEGQLDVNIIDVLGNEAFIEYIVAPRAFATPHLFNNDSTLPATFRAIEDGVLLLATKDSVFSLISEHPELLKNFLSVLGRCNKCTTMRLRALSYKNVRSRFVAYLFEKRIEANNTVEVEHNQVQLASYLYVTRPALSKEINKMVREKLIAIEGKTIHLLDIGLLRKSIM